MEKICPDDGCQLKVLLQNKVPIVHRLHWLKSPADTNELEKWKVCKKISLIAAFSSETHRKPPEDGVDSRLFCSFSVN